MNLNATKFGLASAGAIAAIWIICSVFVLLLPDISMNAGGYMMHADLSTMQWQPNLTGFIAGLVIWSLTAGITGWMLAWFYNKLS